MSSNLKATAYHELGHAFMIASFGEASYVDVISKDGHGGHTFAPTMEDAGIFPTLLRRLGGGMAEYLLRTDSPSSDGLIAFLKSTDSMRSDRALFVQDLQIFVAQSGEPLDGFVESWYQIAAQVAFGYLYKFPRRQALDELADQLLVIKSGIVRPLGDRVVLNQCRPLTQLEASALAAHWPTSAFRATEGQM